MVKKVLAIGGIVSALFVMGQPRECRAGWCPSYKCFGPCGQCACVSSDYSGGTCVDIDQLQSYLDRGYHEFR